MTELADAAGRAVAALAPDEGEGATALIGGAERSLAEVARIAPELEVAAGELRDTELRLAETTLELRRFLDSLAGRARPARAGRVRVGADRRRQAAIPVRDLRGAARAGGRSPRRAGCARGRRRSAARRRAAALAEAEKRTKKLAERLSKNRRAAAASRSRPRSKPSCTASVSARASSGPRSENASRARPARTRCRS